MCGSVVEWSIYGLSYLSAALSLSLYLSLSLPIPKYDCNATLGAHSGKSEGNSYSNGDGVIEKGERGGLHIERTWTAEEKEE